MCISAIYFVGDVYAPGPNWDGDLREIDFQTFSAEAAVALNT
jgi:hypothetical protein